MTTLKQILMAIAATAVSVHASPVSPNVDDNVLAARSGACNQGDCPDFNAAFDLYYRRSILPVNGSAITVETYEGRINDCGKCQKIFTNKDGCFNFTSCGRKQNICVDFRRSRAHRIWKDNNHKSCYHIKADYFGNCGIATSNSASYHPDRGIPCNF